PSLPKPINGRIPNRHDTGSTSPRSVGEDALIWDTISHYSPVLIAPLANFIAPARPEKNKRSGPFSGHGEAQSLGGFEVDRQFERGRLQDRQFGRVRTLENAAGIDGRLAIRPGEAGRIADQATCFDVIAQFVDRRDRMSRRQRDDLLELAPQNRSAPQ